MEVSDEGVNVIPNGLGWPVPEGVIDALLARFEELCLQYSTSHPGVDIASVFRSALGMFPSFEVSE